MLQLATLSDIPISSYEQKTIKTLTSDNSTHEGRTEVNPLTFLIGSYLWDLKMRSKIAKKLKKFQLSLPKVTEVKLGSRFRKPQGSVETNSHLNLTFRSRVMKKNVLFDPKMTSDLMPAFHQNFTLTNSLLVPKNQMRRTLSLEVIVTWWFPVFGQYLTSRDPYRHQKQ